MKNTKKIKNCFLWALFATFCSCNADAILFDEFRKEKQQEMHDDTPQIKMTFTGSQITIHLIGDGSASIDWGDGMQTITLAAHFHETECKKEYPDATDRTIIISGDHITGLICNGNQLTELEVSDNPALTLLFCSDNALTVLNIGANTALKELQCDNNQLTEIIANHNTALEILNCSVNQLSSLSVSNNTALKWLIFADNQITNLNLSSNTALSLIDCQNNQFSDFQLNSLFDSLHGNTVDGGKSILISGNAGAAACNKSIAENKGWIVER